MAKKDAESKKGEVAVKSGAAPSNAIQDQKLQKWLETVVAILLGLTTLVSAWASWIGSLHSGIQSINFTKSNNMASRGTAEYNMGMQLYLADYMSWNTLKDYQYELEAAQESGDKAKIELISNKIEAHKKTNLSIFLAEAIEWMEKNDADSPFNMPGLTEKYFETAEANVSQSQELLEEGMRDNTKGDSYNLVTVIYSLTLFLLGIINTFKNMHNKIAVLGIAVAFLILGFIYMCTIPLPTGFAQMNFFEFD
ncbi:MAG: hypothetical protein IJI50_03170 [Ruminococcus sp.]|nr:hypothetical protein [Ruminococcus sp.]